MDPGQESVHSVSIVIPVYRGAETLPGVVNELLGHAVRQSTACGHPWQVAEILLVHDNGPDDSDATIRALAADHDIVRPVWLSRNFGQHAATLAGMASSSSDWIVTIDEDGQQDPQFIGDMLDTAMGTRSEVVYGAPTLPPPSHGALRNTLSKTARFVFLKLLSEERNTAYDSYRLVLGEVGRTVAAYAGSGIYLDVALGWVASSIASTPVVPRSDDGRPSGYSLRSLASHFWRLVLTSGTRPLRLMSLLGAAFAAVGFAVAVGILVGRLAGWTTVSGWASLTIVALVGFGLVLFTLGLVAEYVGASAKMAMGRPAFVIVSDRELGPLGRLPHQPRS